MRSAVRGGKVYVSGEPGFEEAWSANMREIHESWVDDWRRKHIARLATDLAYQAEFALRMAEYDRAFAKHA